MYVILYITLLNHFKCCHYDLKKRKYTDDKISHENWLTTKVEEYEKDKQHRFFVPKKTDGTTFFAKDLYDDQQKIAFVIMKKLQEWVDCDNFEKFEPLRLTVMGAGGTGKSVVINTILTIMRNIFGRNDVIQCIAPTGTAASNIGGETIHNFLKMKIQQQTSEPVLGDTTFGILKERLKNLLAIIIDERSLLSSNTLGVASTIVAQTIHGGYNPSVPWGGLPILVVLGDDYQLPSINPGAMDRKVTDDKMRYAGNLRFQELMDQTMELTGSKRIQENQNETKLLNERLRLGELSTSDIIKLRSLTLENMEEKHGKDYVSKLKKDALYIYAKNEKIDEHNLNMIIKNHTKENPIAILKCQSESSTGDKAKIGHFDGKKPPKSALLIRGAKVALQGRNFCPTWGLHNSACGVVQEIVFEQRHNPNHGSLPKYVIVEFPTYSGPIWDENNPKVCKNKVILNLGWNLLDMILIFFIPFSLWS